MCLRLLSLLLLMAAAGCAGTMPGQSAPAEDQGMARRAETTTDLKAEYRALSSVGGTVYRVDPAASRVRIYVFRGGPAAEKLGHNHVIAAPGLEAYAHLPTEKASQSRFDVQVKLDDLVVDDPAVLATAGGNFSGERSGADTSGTKKNMLGEKGLDSAKFPFIHLHSVAVSGDWPVLVAELAVTLHGVTRQQAVMLHVDHSPQEIRVSGTVVLHQSDFGIRPYSILGGLLTVQDAVAMDFELKCIPAVF